MNTLKERKCNSQHLQEINSDDFGDLYENNQFFITNEQHYTKYFMDLDKKSVNSEALIEFQFLFFLLVQNFV